MDPTSLSRAQAAQALNIGLSHLDALIKRGDIPSYKLGRLRRIRLVDIQSFVDTLTVAETTHGKHLASPVADE